MSYRNKKLLKAANDQACVLCGSKGTTVACHLRRVALGSGVGMKPPDCLTAWLCQQHHDALDGRSNRWTYAERQDHMFVAFARTVVQWFEQGIVEVK